jgi:transcriptional regulator with XRE-family HTH domain
MLPIQCRMARAAIGWGVRSLSDGAGVSPDTVARFERGEALKEKTVEALRHAFEVQGVEFTNGDAPGVRLRKTAPKNKSRKIREI